MRGLRKWSFVGIPDQEGVKNVGGRLGTAQGPSAFWKALSRLNGATPVKERLIGSFETKQGKTLEESLEIASMVVKEAVLLSPLSVVVGGGHDHGFSHLKGVRDALGKKRIGCINLDAHLDVREANPLITSGSPFWLAIEKRVIEPSWLVEFGIQPQCNAPKLWEYAKKKKIKIVEFQDASVARFQKEFRLLASKCDAVVISFDVDSVAEAFAPGVSAPQSEGFTPSEIFSMLSWAGKQPKCISLGIFELNPLEDQGGMTAKLAATAAWRFLSS